MIPKARILIIEDEQINAWDIREKLESLGYDVFGSVATGEAAILHVRNDPPDLALMDIGLKGDLDGIEAAVVIRDEFKTPVVFLTAFTDMETMKKAIEADVHGYITKPFLSSELEMTIESVLDMNSRAKPSFSIPIDLL